MKVVALGPKFSYQSHQRKQGRGLANLASEYDVDNIIANLEAKIHFESEQTKKEVRARTTKVLTNFFSCVNNGKIKKNKIKKISPAAKIWLKNLENDIKKTKKFLLQNKDLLIVEADKNGKSVIISAEAYNTKMMSLLDDNTTYKKVKRNLTNTQQLKNNSMVNNWFKNNYIEKNRRDALITKDAQPPQIYGLAKTHKPDMPLRPIVSCIKSSFNKMSLFLVQILANIIGKSKYHIKDSFHFQKFIKHQRVPKGYMLVSFDVVSLYTNIPVKLALEAVENNWEKLKNLTKLPKTERTHFSNIRIRSTNKSAV